MMNSHPYTRLGSRQSIELQPSTRDGAAPDPQAAVIVDEGEGPKTFTNEAEFRRYLEQFPEAENDQATRLFKYGPGTSTSLLLPLFDKFDFERFNMIARGLSASNIKGFSTGVCKCNQCKGGTRCAFRGYECSISFWRHVGSSPDPENRLEVTGSEETFAIYAGGEKSLFELVKWDLQFFRFPSRRLEHTDHAYDALIYSTAPVDAQLSSVPIEYVIEIATEINEQWSKIGQQGARFLSFFAIETLSPRLETDRRIVRHLLGAAQLWKSLWDLAAYQVSYLHPVTAKVTDQDWLEGAMDPNITLQTATTAHDLLIWQRDAIKSLINETDSLIQRITNLIAIDEGYRSRDQNGSIRRLSWITFIFLPLMFVSSIFGMNVDVFQNNPSWKYYIAFVVPTCFGVALGYLLLRNWQSIARWILSKLADDLRGGDEAGETLLDNSTVLSWAAATGQMYFLASVLGEMSSSASRGQSWEIEQQALLSAIQNGQAQTARMLIQNPSINVHTADAEGKTPLHHACAEGLADVVEPLLSKGASIERKDNGNLTPLDYAIRGGYDECVALILRLKRFPNCFVEEGTLSSLHYAAQAADVALFQLLIRHNFPCNSKDSRGRNPLFYALESGNLEFFKEALAAYPDINFTDFQGFSLLHAAVEMNFAGAVEHLLKSGLRVDLPAAGSLRTPLLCLSLTPGPQRLQIARLLLDNGADPEEVDSWGQSLAHILCQSPLKCSAILKLLLDQQSSNQSAGLHQADMEGNTPHHLAAAVGNLDAIRALLKDPAGFAEKDRDGLLPVQVAARNGHINVVAEIHPNPSDQSSADVSLDLRRSLFQSVLERDDVAKFEQIVKSTGANLRDDEQLFELAVLCNAVNILRHLLDLGCPVDWATAQSGHYNSTILQKAISAECEKTVLALLEVGVSVDTQDDYQWTCLHSAAVMGNYDAATIIAARISDKGLRDVEGWSALDLAVHYGHEAIRTLLLDGGDYVPVWEMRRLNLTSAYYPGCSFLTPEGVIEPLELPALHFGQSQ